MTSLIEKRIPVYSIPSDLWCTSKSFMLYCHRSCNLLTKRTISGGSLFCKWLWSSDWLACCLKEWSGTTDIFSKSSACKEDGLLWNVFCKWSKKKFKEDMTLIIANYLDHRDWPDPCKEDDNFFGDLKYCLQGCQTKLLAYFGNVCVWVSEKSGWWKIHRYYRGEC